MEAFAQAASAVLDRKEVKIHGPYADGHYIAQHYAKDFVLWWRNQNLNSLKPLIERFPLEYLRGRFDSDGCVEKYELTLCGAISHIELMKFERSLCLKLGMRTGRIRPYGKIGQTFFVGAKRITTKQQKIRFSVNSGDFLRVVGHLNVVWREATLQASKRRRGWTSWPEESKELAHQIDQKHLWNRSQIAVELSGILGRRVPAATVYYWLRPNAKSHL